MNMILLGIYGVLFLVSREIELKSDYRIWEIPFYKAAVFLQGKRKGEGKNKRKKQQLQSLFTTRRIAWEQYEIKKISNGLMILFFVLCLSIICSLLFQQEAEVLFFLERPSYGEKEKIEELDVYVKGGQGEGKEYQIPVSIKPRQYSSHEAKQKVEETILKLDTIVIGENETLDEVRSDLLLPKTVEDGAVLIQWVIIPYGILSETGKILKQTNESGEVVELEATVQCQEEKGFYRTFAKIFPKRKTAEETMIQNIEKAVEKQGNQDLEKQQMSLPKEVDGKDLTWKRTAISSASVISMIGILAAAFFGVHQDQNLEKAAKKRQEQLKMDYAVLVFKLRMLLGAGMTIRGAFFRVAAEYEEREKKEIRYVYEEMVYVCQEMKSGVSEEKAYEYFGQRCGHSRYLKLGRILAQHLKKGTEGLEEILGQEMQQSQEERMALARQLGEEAGTKLLLPMGMMLLVVLVILVLPAFLNF